MKLVRLISHENTQFDPAMKLYRISFPPHEHRALVSQQQILSNPEYHFDLIYEDALFIGILLYWETKTFLYVEHFCIEPTLRNKNYGAGALALLRDNALPVILEIDPLTDEKAVRRKAFYERAGYLENPYPHIHPPYTTGSKGHSLLVMSCPKKLDMAEYALFNDYLKTVVMA